MFKIIFLVQFLVLLILSSANAEKIDKINIIGNERISKDTIIIFGEVDIEQDFDNQKINNVLKKLYNTNFFSDIKIDLKNNTLTIIVVENPIIQDVQY